MATCPVCQSKVSATANFCAECGVELSGAASERAWVVAMQEKIQSIRHNDTTYNAIAVVGIAIAVAVPFLLRYVLHFSMDLMSWLFTAVGVVFLFASVAALWWDDSKVKKLINELKKGQPVEESSESAEEKSDSTSEETS